MAIRFAADFEEAAPVEYFTDDDKQELSAQEASAVALIDIARSLRSLTAEQQDLVRLIADSNLVK